MSILAAVAVPHPPVIFPEIGKGREKEIQKTIDSYRQAMRFISEFKPDTIVLTTPHSELYADYFHISGDKEASGNFAAFQAPEVVVHADYDQEFVTELEKACAQKHIPCGTKGEISPTLDHATMIPLRFLNEFLSDYKVVRIGLSGLSLLTHYNLGQTVKEVAQKLNRRTVFIASGDLSHKLLDEGPYGFMPEGPQYDKKVTEVLDKGDFLALFNFKSDFCEKAAECGHRSFVIMAGALDSKEVESKLLSYEGPFGVGYGVAEFNILADDKTRNFGQQFKAIYDEQHRKHLALEDVYIRLARLTVETYVKTGKIIALPPDTPQELLHKKSGAFVCIKKYGQLRGCIGTFLPTQLNIAYEIIQNAVSACSNDYRFNPVHPEELEELIYSVDILFTPEPINSIEQLDAKKYGVIVQNANRRGLLLPNLEGIDTPAQQISIAKQKASIGANEPVMISRFEVERHEV